MTRHYEVGEETLGYPGADLQPAAPPTAAALALACSAPSASMARKTGLHGVPSGLRGKATSVTMATLDWLCPPPSRALRCGPATKQCP